MNIDVVMSILSKVEFSFVKNFSFAILAELDQFVLKFQLLFEYLNDL